MSENTQPIPEWFETWMESDCPNWAKYDAGSGQKASWSEGAKAAYRHLSSQQKIKPKDGYFVAECPKCGFRASSSEWIGGGQIADTGDYGDSYCPVCGQIDCDEADDETYIDQRGLLLKTISDLREQMDKMHREQESKASSQPSPGIMIDLLKWVICVAPPEHREEKPFNLKGFRFKQNGELIGMEEVVSRFMKQAQKEKREEVPTPSVQPIDGGQKSIDPELRQLLHCMVSAYEGICFRLPSEDRNKFLRLPSFVKACDFIHSEPAPEAQPIQGESLEDKYETLLQDGMAYLVDPAFRPASQPIADKEVPEPKDIHFTEEGRMPNAFIRDVDDHVYLTPILPQCHEMGKEDIWFAGIRDGAQFMYNRLAGIWSMPAAVLQKWCKRVEGENATQSIQIAGLLASNKEWGEKYAAIEKEAMEYRKELKKQMVWLERAEYMVAAQSIKSLLDKYPSLTNTDKP